MSDLLMVGCRTNDTRDDGPNHFMMGLPQEFAQQLMKYAEAHRAAQLAAETGVYCVEIFYSAGEWGNIDGLEIDRRTQDWVALPWETKIEKPESVEFETLKVMDDGVVFSAAWKNDDSGVYFETPVLPWKVIRAIAEKGKPPKDAFPAATIDMEENGKIENEDDEDEEEDDEDDEVVGHDQNGEPVTHHSTGHPACPAVHGGVCPIKGHNEGDHDGDESDQVAG